MKPPLTLENKQKFFAQYWGQEVVRLDSKGRLYSLNTGWLAEYALSLSYLELTPLSKLSDDQIKNICNILKVSPNEAGYDKSWRKLKTEIQSGTSIETIISLWDFYGWGLSVYDYLRENGIALPWMGILVEEQVEAGWVKLKTKLS